MPSRRRPRATAAATRGSSSATSTRMRSTVGPSALINGGLSRASSARLGHGLSELTARGQARSAHHDEEPWRCTREIGTEPAPRDGARGGAVRGQARHRRPGRDARAAAGGAAGGRPRAARGRPRPGQDPDGQDARVGARRIVHARAVHAGPGPLGPRRHARLPARRRARSTSSSAPCSATSCSPTRSTARPPRCSPRCSRSCRSGRSRSAARPTRVPRPFLVMATQNPIESEGTYPLPEAQVDRFLFKLLVGYPIAGRGGRRRRARDRAAGRGGREAPRPRATGGPRARSPRCSSIAR